MKTTEPSTTQSEHTPHPPLPDSALTRRQYTPPIAVVAWLRIARIFQKIDRRTATTLRDWNLSVSRFDVLNHAGAQEGRPQQDLARSLLVTKGNITQLLDAMEYDGLVERRKCGRTNLVYLTDEGRTLRTQSLADHERRIIEEFSVLTPEETETLLTLLRKLDRSLPEP
ncbi:MAG: MarR family winged helix-turn-helix transcriptional regulator [Thermomicrobiales bacterium]